MTTQATIQAQFTALAIGEYNSHEYKLLSNPESGLQLLSDEYIITDLMRELETSIPPQS